MRIDELERIRRYEALNRCRAACEKEVNVLERVVAELEDKHAKALERIRELEDEVEAYRSSRIANTGDDADE